MIKSMTALAAGTGSGLGYSWTWELRSVNGKGLDLRLRVPEGISGLEAALREQLGKTLARGNVSVSLRLQADGVEARLTLNETMMDTVLTSLAEIEARAIGRGLSMTPPNAAQVLSMRGVLDSANQAEIPAELGETLVADFAAILDSFVQMRAQEGEALNGIMTRQLDDIGGLVEQAAGAAEARLPKARQSLQEALARVLDNTDGVDEARITQELAILAVKGDITEEIDRLRAHVGAARALIAQGSPIGRKLDFLMQEFNREANTLCSKSQDVDLTRIGLELKTIIDQMREQVQNVE